MTKVRRSTDRTFRQNLSTRFFGLSKSFSIRSIVNERIRFSLSVLLDLTVNFSPIFSTFSQRERPNFIFVTREKTKSKRKKKDEIVGDKNDVLILWSAARRFLPLFILCQSINSIRSDENFSSEVKYQRFVFNCFFLLLERQYRS